jgi:hypothetical protein
VPTPAPRKSVFISHISAESDVAQWLKSVLDRDFLGTLDIFVSSDQSIIEAGQRWLDEVDKALKRADLTDERSPDGSADDRALRHRAPGDGGGPESGALI